MRNLINVEHVRKDFQSQLPLRATAWDTTNDALICAFGPSSQDQVIELRRIQTNHGSESNLLASWDALSPLPDISVDNILSIHHFGHNDSTCLVLAGGDIVVVRSQPGPDQDKIEIVGSVDAGIMAAAWSPDEELLAVATRASTFLYMTADFECISNVTFSPEDSKLSKQVSVGWGKAETQFKGKRAHALRDPTMPEHVDQGQLSERDDGTTSISWRGDGAFVAVNTIESLPKKRRMIRVYSRDGDLDSVSEAVDGLEGALSWRPAGNITAGVQRRDISATVVFFERNGLRHGEFDLRLNSDDLRGWASSIGLQWNLDSSILAVTFANRIQLWTMGNYHYYLKQEIALPTTDSSSSQVRWHPEDAFRFSSYAIKAAPAADAGDLPSFDHSVDVLRYVFDMSNGPCTPPNDFGMTAVIDGRNLRLTPLRIANVPPPMAYQEIDLETNAIDIAFNRTNTLVAVLQARQINTYRLQEGSKTEFDPLSVKSVPLPTETNMVPHHVCFVNEDTLLVLMVVCQTGTTVILNCTSGKQALLNDVQAPISLSSSSRGNTACLSSRYHTLEFTADQLESLQYNPSAHLICNFPTACSIVQAVSIDDVTVAFGLTSSGTLYANDRSLVKNCTSFAVTDAHLLFTTSNHLLKFVHLLAVDDMEVPPDEPETDERCRSIERGAKLVAVMPTTFAVVLQMPRGNLETIYPRALVLAAIRRFIEAKQYRSAFLACRNQRVDMNIIYDHMPAQLLQNVGLFLSQLKNPGHVDLFLSQLGPEDVSKSMYKETLPRRTALMDQQTIEQTVSASPEKVNKICDAFLSALRSSSSPNVQNIITSHLCKIPADIEAGLREISGLPQDEIEGAVEHICFLADVNRVYEAALGSYNLKLTLLVAQQSQKDPREYLPYLQNLQQKSQLQRQFTINDDLGRRKKALLDLHSQGDLKALIAYTNKHELYPQALELYKYSPQDYNTLLRLYADHLSSYNKHKEAGIAYESLSEYVLASESYRAVNRWRESLSCAALCPTESSIDISELATSLSDSLEESKEFASVASLRLMYLKDISGCAKFYCKAYKYSEAIEIVAQHSRADLIKEVIDPGIAEGAATLTEMLTECKGQVGAQVPRLRELRALKVNDPLAFYEGAVPGGVDIPDNISLAPSATSTTGNTFMTRYTQQTGTIRTSASRKTSKNKRREERKRARGKKGSVYEEEYLVNSIGRLVDRVNEVSVDVSKTVDACMRRGMRERASALEEVMVEVVALCKGCLDEVYEIVKVPEAPENERPGGADGVFWDSLEEKQKRVAPTVKAFESNALLAV